MLLKEIQLPVREEVDNIINAHDPSYIPLPKTGSNKKGKKKKFPENNKAYNSLVNTIWFYGNADAN